MNKELKILYIMLMVAVFGLWVSTIALQISQIGGSAAARFSHLLGGMLIACIYDFIRKIKKSDEELSVCIPALSIVSCAFYLFYVGVLAGRIFARSFF